MKRRALSSLAARPPRRPRPRAIVLLTVLAAVMLCAAAGMPAAAVAAVADPFEPDGSAATASPIVVDAAAQQHTIHVTGDQDWVSFPVTAGSTYTIQTADGTPSESLDTVLYLYDADGTTQLDYNDDYLGLYSRIVYTADADKTVFAWAGGLGSSTGAYALNLTSKVLTADAFEPDDSYATASPIVVDAAAQQHTIHLDDDEDWVSFAVTAGRAYTIQTVEGTPTDSMDTVLYLYDSDGMTLIDYNYDDPGSGSYYSRIDYIADADKTVYAMVQGGDYGRTGAYALSVKPVGDSYEPDGSFGVATPLTVGAAAQQHSIDPDDDEDWVSFTVETGYKYALTTAPGASPDDANTELYLYDSDGTTLLTSNGDDETEDRGYYSRIDYTADADKTVYAKVDGWYTGTYALSVALVGDSYEPDDSHTVATPLTVGGPAQQHTLDPAGDDDWFSFPVEAGWRYAIEAAPGTPPDDPDTVLYLYDSDGTTFIDSNNDDEGRYSRLEYEAEQNKTVYAMVAGYDTGTYALSVTRTPIMKIGVVPTSVDFGSVAVGDSLQQTVVVQNLGVAPLDVGDVQVTGADFSIVRDDAGGVAIPVGGSREIDVAYTPTVAYTGAPTAVQHDWTSLIAQYNYSGAVLLSVSLYTGFENVGGAGDLGYRVRIGATDWTGTGAVVAGGKYIMRVVVSPGSGSTVQVLEPMSDTFNISQTGSSVLGVTYLRVPDAYLSIASNDDDEPTIDVNLFGSAVPGGAPDTTAPVTTDDADDLWHNAPVTVNLTAVDNEGGSGMVGGAAKTEYKVDGAATWTTGTSVLVDAPAGHANDGVHTISYRSTDRAGNVEAAKSCTVKIDTTPPDGSFALAGGAAETTSTSVTASLAVTEPNGPVEMRFSTDAGTSWSAWATYAATAPLTLPDGLGTKTAWAQVRDAAGNVLELADDIELVEGPADVTAPTVTAAGATAGAWYRTDRLVTLSATDELGGVGVASITYTLDGVETTVLGVSTAVSVPVSPNGAHTLVFRATDHAANPSPDQTLRFTCDSTGPVTAGKATSGRVNRVIYLRYKIGDNLSPKAKAIKIVVKNRAGKTVKTFRPTTKNTATWYRVKWVPKRKGTYRYYVYAKDLAGNAQRTRGSAKVVVR